MAPIPIPPITITHPPDHTSREIEYVPPLHPRWMLGVILAPDGSSRQQIQVLLQKAKAFQDKIKHSSLPQDVKWIAIQMVLDPCIMYPLMAAY
jgi:hypothetical protein